MARVSSRAFAELNGLLASAVERGVALDPAVGLLSGQISDAALRGAVRNVAAALREGVPLPEALAREPGAFPSDYVAFVRAGLEGGRLAEVLRHTQTYYRLRARVADQLRRLALYLLCGTLLCAAVLVAVLRVGRSFDAVYREVKIGAPRLTRAFLWVSRNSWILAAGAAAAGGAVLALRLALRGRPLAGRMTYGVPLWGRLQKDRDLALFCSVLALRLRTSATLPAALEAAAGALPNAWARGAASRVRRRVQDGESLSSALYYERFFPRTLAWAVGMAEARDDLADTFDTFAGIYARDLDLSFQLLLLAVTPLGILALANAGLVCAAALLLPLVFLLDALGSFRRGGRPTIGQEAAALLPSLFALNGFLLATLGTTYGLVVRRRARVYLLVEHLAALARKDLPFQAGLRALGQDLGGTLGLDLSRVSRRLEEGMPLSEAMDRQGGRFPPLLRMLVAMGDQGGRLPAFLEEARRSYARAAELPYQSPYFFIYPLVLSVGLNVTIAVIHRTILPRFQELVVQLRVASAADRWWPVLSAANHLMLGLTLGFAVAILFGDALARLAAGISERARRAFERLLLALPVLGRLRRDAAVHRFALGVGIFLRAGAALPEAARAAARAEPSVVFRKRYEALTARLVEGARFSQAARDVLRLPEDFLWFVETGEASGGLPDHLVQGAIHYDTKARLAAHLAARAAVPVFVVANGGLVLATAALVFLPLRDLVRGILPW
jgi:general secretion pathway protein F